VQILTKDAKWKYSAPAIPTSHWIDRGLMNISIEGMEHFLVEIKDYTCELRSGACCEDIYLGGLDGFDFDVNGNTLELLHDDALLPHWQEFANAMQLLSRGFSPRCRLCRFILDIIRIPWVVCVLFL
jgi:hypothetical protein